MNMSSAKAIEHQHELVELILIGGVSTASGALAGHLFQLISPVGGAVFGGAIFGAGRSLSFVENRLHNFFWHSEFEKVVKVIVKCFLSIVAGIALVNYGLGVSLSMVNAVSLTGTTVLISVITASVLNIIPF